MDSETTLTFDVDHELPPSELLYVFGGPDPVATLGPRTLLSTSTRDCFAGLVRTTADRPSQVCDPRFLNPRPVPSP
jgi:hypothetical protein